MNIRMTDGYCYKLIRRKGKPVSWRDAGNDSWTPSVTTKTEGLEHVGTRVIDDAECHVFESRSGQCFAQLVQNCKSEPA